MGNIMESFVYPIKTQCKIIIACCFLHYLIRTEMSYDPMEAKLDRKENITTKTSNDQNVIGTIELSYAWTAWRDALATKIFNEWRTIRGVDIRSLIYLVFFSVCF